MINLEYWDDKELRDAEAASRREAAFRRSSTNSYRGTAKQSAEQDEIARRHEDSADRIAAEIARRASLAQQIDAARTEAARRAQETFRAEHVDGGPSVCPDHGTLINDDGSTIIVRCVSHLAHEGCHRDQAGRIWI